MFIFWSTANTGTFSAKLEYTIKDCDPNSGLPTNDEGVDDDYIVSTAKFLRNKLLSLML